MSTGAVPLKKFRTAGKAKGNGGVIFARAGAIASKEVMHIVRDPFTLGLAIGIPFILVLFFGFAIDFEFRDMKIAAYDHDGSRASRELLQNFSSSGYFKITQGERPGMPLFEVESGKAFASLVIPPGFGKTAAKGERASVQVLVDGSDNQKTGIVSGYITGIQLAAARKAAGGQLRNPYELRPRFLYNQTLNTRWFIVPGLIVVVVGLLSILMTALTVAREWENGSMELLLSTPVTPLEVVAGKIAPYVLIGLAGIGLVYSVARIVFGVPFEGSYALFFAACILFISTSLAQGLLISVITRQQQKAMQASMIAGLLPALLLSGFIFPVESMPLFFQYFTVILPPRWFMTIIRTLFLKGNSLSALFIPFMVLLLMNIVFLTAAAKRFKKDVEP